MDIQVLKADIPMETAMLAHRGTSFVPEQRAEQERQEYADTLMSDYTAMVALADTEDKRVVLEVEFQRYREGFRVRYLAHLSAMSRCMSSMIAGPARFPTARNAKRSDTADKRRTELLEYRERALKAIRRSLCPEDAPIMSGDTDAVERLKTKIAEAEGRRAEMKELNAAARRMGTPPPYDPFELTNLGANIRRMKERVESVARAKAVPASVVQGAAARMEDCPAENRVRLFFPGKPDADVRGRLKSNGFRWTPSLGCWQAYRNDRSLSVATAIAQIQPYRATIRR